MPSDERRAQHRPSTASLIAAHGFAVTCVGYGVCDAPGCRCTSRARTPWTYTVGLVDLDQPELVLMGLDPVAAHSAVSWVADERRAGRPVPLGEPFLLERSAMKALTAIKVLDVPDEWVLADVDRMATWFAHFGTGASSLPVPSVQQVVWADRAGRFPDDPRCADRVVREQPILRDAPLHHPVRAAGPRERHRRR